MCEKGMEGWWEEANSLLARVDFKRQIKHPSQLPIAPSTVGGDADSKMNQTSRLVPSPSTHN